MILQRVIHQVHPGKWEELQAIETRFDVIHARLGVPPRRRYRRIYGKHCFYTEVIEREWDNLAAMEAQATEWARDPELRALQDEACSLIECTQYELYQML